MFRSFFTTIFRGSSAVLCAVTIPPADLRSLSLYYYAVCGHITSRSPIDKNTKHTQVSLDFFRSNVYMFHILDIMNIVEIIVRNCCITDDIHMRPHTA